MFEVEGRVTWCNDIYGRMQRRWTLSILAERHGTVAGLFI